MNLSLSEENYNTKFSFRSKDEEIKDNQFGPGVSCSCPLEFYCPATNKSEGRKTNRSDIKLPGVETSSVDLRISFSPICVPFFLSHVLQNEDVCD
ncbi:hypothetical protein CDAR_61371 [Caerostris darwini]|uniref:Uncharacterized protein n=1 Tax=Caerostris darwini TaxID=1538125 RepID=A0AAV4RS42_9ARAC|nr:hypothetical protein CDAR_61371 [Caerostris darwini]